MTQPVERESMEVDVLYVGAGPATLASVLHLMRSVETHNREAGKSGRPPIEPPSVLVIEKSANIGDHMLSGAVINPAALDELVPDFAAQGFPTEYVCTYAGFWLFHPWGRIKVAPVPANFRKGRKLFSRRLKGYHVASLSNVVKWLAERAEGTGVEIYPGFAGDELLVEGGRVVGVRTGDMGIDKSGKPKANFQPGMDIFAKVTVLGEGVRGTLARQLIERFGLEGRHPQTFETGIKEIWRIDPKKHRPGRVVHGAVLPEFLRHFHGMWLYDMQDHLVSLGFVTLLESEDPNCDPHLEMQKFKTNPWIRDLLEGGELVRYGAKCIPTGGLYSQPKLYCDGALLVGDAASFCNAQNLAGVHMAMKSGMLAAETLVEAFARQDWSAKTLGSYAARYRSSWAWEEHHRARNYAASVQRGPAFFMLNEPLRLISRGRGLADGLSLEAGHTRMRPLADLPREARRPEPFAFDNVLTFSKEHLVQFSGTKHEVDQPSHLVVADTDLCSTTCAEEFGNPCERFCPAAVYEMVDDPAAPGRKKLFIHHENCVHCKTCDIADPYQVITWTPPEGGEGPDYQRM